MFRSEDCRLSDSSREQERMADMFAPGRGTFGAAEIKVEGGSGRGQWLARAEAPDFLRPNDILTAPVSGGGP